jgi:hypothetical protein
MIYPLMTATNQEEYKKLLCLIGSLSNLFSESDVPYLYYRIAEKIFCKAFNAEDLSRSDVSVDAKYYITGVGIKTFIRGNNKTYQKITEFGSCSRQIYQNLSVEDKIQKIAEIRNERILTTHRIHGIKQSIYHCLVREQNRFNIFEEEMSFINLSKIKNIKESTSSISFSDE